MARVAPRAAPGGGRPGVRLERALQPGGDDRAGRAPLPGHRAGRAPRGEAGTSGGRPGWTPGGRRRRQRKPSSRRLEEPTEPGAHAALSRLYADGDLVYTASSMPIRDQEAFVPSASTPGEIPLQPGRERDRRPDLLGDRRRGRERPPHLDRHRRPRPVPRHERARRAPPRGGRRCGSSCSTTTAAGSSSSCPRPSRSSGTSSRRCWEPRWGWTWRGSPPCTTCRTCASSGWISWPTPPPAGPALIEIPVDRRRNVELHQRIAGRVGEALGARHGA